MVYYKRVGGKTLREMYFFSIFFIIAKYRKRTGGVFIFVDKMNK